MTKMFHVEHFGINSNGEILRTKLPGARYVRTGFPTIAVYLGGSGTRQAEACPTYSQQRFASDAESRRCAVRLR